MIVLIDNYDSFTFNLYQILAQLDDEVEVVRNDAVSIEEIQAYAPTHIVVSPGPGKPEDAGISIECINFFKNKLPILGVCLGHQAITAAFGGEVKRAGRLMHGKISLLTHENQGLFKGLPQKFKVMRYHSLITNEEVLPEALIVTARTLEGEIMGIEHNAYPVFGLQFHPEAYLTEYGAELLSNFLRRGNNV